MIQLRDYQRDVVSRIYKAWSDGAQNVAAVCPTGAGKSLITSQIVLDQHKAGRRQVVLAHRNELVGQMSMHIARRGIKHRIIGSRSTIAQVISEHRREFGGVSFVNPDADCSVGSVQTVLSREAELRQWAAQIDDWTVDEFHHTLKNNQHGRCVAMFTNAKGLGVTATPQRADGMGLGRHADGLADEMIVGPTMRWLIDQGNLSDYEIAVPDSDFSIDDEQVAPSGDWSTKKMREASKRSHIVGDVVQEYLRRSPGQRGLCFATDVETAGEISAKFNQSGVRAAAVSAKTPPETRAEYIRRFRDGRLDMMVNVDLFGEGFDCLDTETEILTPSGWKNWHEAYGQTQCYAWNPETTHIELADIQTWGIRPLKEGERMWHVKSQHADICVSENHRIFYRKKNHLLEDGMGKDVHVRTAAELHMNRRPFAVPLSGEMDFDGVPLSDDEISIVAWYLTDGWLQKNNKCLCIAQTKPEGVQEITGILERLGWNYRTRVRPPAKNSYKSTKPSVEFSIEKGQGWSHLSRFFVKDVCSDLHQMTRRQFKIFWESLLDGDGSRQGNRSGTLTCARKTQVDAYMQMAVLRGFAVMHGNYRSDNDVLIYSLRVRDEKWLRMVPKDQRGAKFTLKAPKNGVVWCVQNSMGTLITRRRGKVVILGNCPAASVVIMARPTASLGVYLQQFGRALRIDPANPNKVGLVIDHVSNWKRHGLPDKPHAWTLDRREKRAKKEPDPDDMPLTACRECSRPYERALPACPYCGAVPPAPDGARTLEQVDGDLVLLDRDTLARLRAAAEIESPAAIEGRVSAAAGPIAGRGAANRQIDKIAARGRLDLCVAQWAAVRRTMGEDDRVIHRRLYLATGMSLLEMQAQDRQTMERFAGLVESWYQ